MEKKIEMSSVQRNIERLELWINSLFFVGAAIVSIFTQQSLLVAVLCVLALGSSWYFVVSQKGDYRKRAFATVFFVQIIFLVLYIMEPELPLFFISYIAMVVTSGLYGIEQIILIPVVSNTLFWIVHIITEHGGNETIGRHFVRYLMPVLIIYFINFILYIWLRNRSYAQVNLEKTINMLERAEQSKHGFLMNVSHEIRTPLHGIIGVCESLQEEENVDYIHSFLKYISSSSFWMTGLFEDLMDYSVLQSQKLTLENEQYHTKDLIEMLDGVAMALSSTRNLELIFDVDASIPKTLFGDKNRIGRIVGTILGNAYKYTEAGGIRLSITMSKDVAGISLIITITDTGRGIEPGKLQTIQEVFRKEDFSVKPNEQGIGLGLFLSYVMTTMMGGNISIQSQVGKGTTVNIIIPQKVMEDKSFVSSCRKKTICFIDDEMISGTQISNAYKELFHHMSEQLQCAYVFCNSMIDFQDRLRIEDFENIITSSQEYTEYKSYFDELAEWHQVLVAREFDEKLEIENDKICQVMKPLRIDSVVDAFIKQEIDGKQDKKAKEMQDISIVAPDARILVVDDNQMNLEVIKRLLEPVRAKLYLANNGQKAIAIVQEETIDLVLMDHMMPGMDGVDVMKEIRNLPGERYKNMPIVVVTANKVDGVKREFMRRGFSDFAEKPLEKNVLFSLLYKHLPRDKYVIETPEQVAKKEVTRVSEDNFYIGALNTKLGVTYCGGKEEYLTILEEYAVRGKNTWDNLQKHFKEENWKDYTIEVHGIKSAMLTIGAKEISKRAKALEQAGKDGDVFFIREHHQSMIDLCYRMLADIRQYFYIEDTDEKEIIQEQEVSDLQPISPEEIAELLKDMEDKAFMLDKEGMMQCGKKLEGRSYNDKALHELLDEYYRKVDRDDFLSAWEFLQKAFGAKA